MQTTTRSRIPSLDGIRAVAFSLVFAAHNSMGKFIPAQFGVAIFFFLSGYLITTLMRIEYETTGRISFRHFYLRRMIRIFPPFYIVFALQVGFTLAGLLPGTLITWKVIAQALHVANFLEIQYGLGGTPIGTGVLWSLAVEEHFYLVFPMLYLWTARLNRPVQVTVFLAICLLILVWRGILFYHFRVPIVRIGAGTDTRADAIVFGCILGVWLNPVLDEIPFPPWAWGTIIAPLACMLLAATLIVRGTGGHEAFHQVPRYTLQAMALFPLFIVAVRFPHWIIVRFLNLRVMMFLGALSYTLYLVHDTVIGALQHVGMPALATAAIALVGSFTIATAVYWIVERPCARLRRRLHREPNTR